MEQWETQVLPLLPASLAKELQAGELAGAEEIRIRVNRPVQVLGKNNRLLQWTPTPAMCQEVLLRLCRQSIYAYGPELAACYMTLPGGVRVGLAGRMTGVGEEARLVTATGFNIRLAYCWALRAFGVPCCFPRRGRAKPPCCGMRQDSCPLEG